MMTSLADSAFRQLQADFTQWGLPLEGEQEAALKSFLSVLEKGLRGELEDKFYLLSLDPGMGKTSACAAFLKAWRMNGYQPKSSVLVGISTLSELRAFIDGAGLPSSDFGVLTADVEMNSLGLPRDRQADAKVLFTSQAMIRSRTNARRFAETSDFHFQGQPRALRLWDEDILPSEWKTVRLDDLAALASPLRPRFPALAKGLTDFAADIATTEVDHIVLVPSSLHLPRASFSAASELIALERLQSALETIQLMAGSQMRVQNGDYFGKQLVGVREALPGDIVPLVVVDASGRVREAYKVWELHRGNLERLPAAGNSYHRLNVHFWQHRSGKDALEEHETCDKFAKAIVEAFDRDPSGRWLILTHKEAKDALKDAIVALAPPVSEDRLHWLHWGRHRSTNEFRDVENIIIVGLLRYREADYLGLSLAASGLPVSAPHYPAPSGLRSGELNHHLLQAVCRASVRKAKGGIAPHCNAYVIGSMSSAREALELTFPECNFIQWKEDGPVANERVEAAIAFLHQRMVIEGVEAVPKRAVREAVGVNVPATFTKLQEAKHFQEFLEWADIQAGHHRFVREAQGFGPVDS